MRKAFWLRILGGLTGISGALLAIFIGGIVGINYGFGTYDPLMIQGSIAMIFALLGVLANVFFEDEKKAGLLTIISGIVVVSAIGIFGIFSLIFLLAGGIMGYRSSGTVRSGTTDSFDDWRDNGGILSVLAVIVMVFLFTGSMMAYGATFGPEEDRSGSNPYNIITTWDEDADPTTEMTVQWFTEEDVDYSLVLEDGESFSANRQDLNEFEEWEEGYHLHRVTVTDLDPGQEYDFHIEGEDGNSSDTYSFKTVSYEEMDEVNLHTTADSRSHWAALSARFFDWWDLIGDWGDWESSYPEVLRDAGVEDPDWNEWAARERVFEDISRRDPDLVVFPGDFLWYGFWETQWLDWFEDWSDFVTTEDGRIPPIVPAVGNHETNYAPPENDPEQYLYYDLFPVSRNYTLDFDGMSIISLDSGHSTDNIGTYSAEVIRDQTDWLEEELKERENKDWIFTQYHVPGFTSGRGMFEDHADVVRDEWAPLFEEHGVDVSFEAHDHTWKYTPPITNAQRERPFGEALDEDREDSVRYIGDGGAGAPLRIGHRFDNWWIEEGLAEYHTWELVISEDNLETLVVFSDMEDYENPFTLEN